MELSIGANAFMWGIASSVSLPLGAALGLWWLPKRKINSAFMAFGAGALLFALSIELFGHVPHHVEEHGWGSLVAAIVGAISGGLLFDMLNSVLNNKGAFLRKLSTARRYVASIKIIRKKKLIGELAKVKVLSQLPPEKMAMLVQRVKEGKYSQGEAFFAQGELAEEMYFICEGQVEIILHKNGGGQETLAILNPGDTFGEIGVMGGFTRTAEAVAKSDARVYRIGKEDVREVLAECPDLKKALDELGAERVEALQGKGEQVANEYWRDEAYAHLEAATTSITMEEINEEAESHGGAAMAIWLGILIDGIPESLVIGMLAVSASGMSMAFIAGVFLANLPEAMSSAVSMRAQGMKLTKIYLMWGSICLITGIGAYMGATLFPAEPTGAMFYFVLGIEGLAAGAMLTMIAETMLPEAFEQGGSIVGLSTLGGFLSALVVKVL